MHRIRALALAVTVGLVVVVVVVVVVGVAAFAPSAPALSTRTSTTAPPATALPATVWLCRPHLADDPCTKDRTATLVSADGTTRTERPVTAKSRPVDCFYVYPTVSLQPTINANLTIDPNETRVAIAQASRFSQVCQVYAPMYHQLTLRAIGGGVTAGAAALAYSDVRNAWRDYLAHDNHGRGVVLIGHSQGAGMLTQLVKQEIDPKPKVRAKLTSALLLGGNVVVPRGRDVGGDFAHVRACRAVNQTGCVVAYSTFDHTPPADSTFARVNTGFNRVRGGTTPTDSEVLCVNPAALRGGAAVVHPYFPAHLNLGVLGGAFPAGAVASSPTPWVSYPGLYKAECRSENGANWLQVDDQRDAQGASADVRPRLVDSLGPGWGLHLVDVNIDQGDLVRLVGRQAAAWAMQHQR
ncbi:MAG: DUF3089 domain-containing protein [Acidimicrobiia bacterium]